MLNSEEEVNSEAEVNLWVIEEEILEVVEETSVVKWNIEEEESIEVEEITEVEEISEEEVEDHTPQITYNTQKTDPKVLILRKTQITITSSHQEGNL